MGHLIRAPRALLWDFGGVLVDGPGSTTWLHEVAGVVARLLVAAGVDPPPANAITQALVADDRSADVAWRRRALEVAVGERRHGPRAGDRSRGVDHSGEVAAQAGAETFWGDVVAATWPAAARDVVVAHAAQLSRHVADARFVRGWRLRPGTAEVLAQATRHGLRMAVVSNTICGQAHRDYLAAAGLEHHFQVQLYSDEEGVRKPGPALLRRAASALGVPPGDCWMIGDTLGRDILAARRAGVGTAVLMRSSKTETPRYLDVEPDLAVADPVELSTLLGQHLPPDR